MSPRHGTEGRSIPVAQAPTVVGRGLGFRMHSLASKAFKTGSGGT